MKKSILWAAGFCFSLLVHALAGAAEADSRLWRIESAREGMHTSAPAIDAQERIVVWAGEKKAVPANVVHIRVDAPFAQVKPLIRQALARHGSFEWDETPGELKYFAPSSEDWPEVLLSWRPDLREALARRFQFPRLELAGQEGALTPSEVARRKTGALASTFSVPQNRAQLSEFNLKYASLSAVLEQGAESSRKGLSRLQVNMVDAAAVFAYPVTVVSISRHDSYPNPDYTLGRVLKESFQFNILGGSHTYPMARASLVPADIFEAVLGALGQIGAASPPQVADSPLRWKKPAAPPAEAKPDFVMPDNTAPMLTAEAFALPLLARTYYARDFLPLPDGDLLLAIQVFAPDLTVQLWRLHEANGQWHQSRVWSGARGAEKLVLSTDGNSVWFSGASAEKTPLAWHVYDVKTQRLVAHVIDAETQGDNYREAALLREWHLDARQQPVFARPDYREAGPLGRAVFQVWGPATERPQLGQTWSFRPMVSSPRQAMMKGNIQLIHWRGAGGVWTEDPLGLAELDVETGRVLRAYPLPRRFLGEKTEGIANWVPSPLGSPQRAWISVGYVLAPERQTGLALQCTERNVGMHVVNLQDGSVSFSAMLGCASTLRAAARSANGRFLALGANHPPPNRMPLVAIWDVDQRKPLTKLQTASRGELYRLAFSWDGAYLWALCGKNLLRWKLPPSLQDKARSGSLPEQSHY